jgi:hypothetical protein
VQVTSLVIQDIQGQVILLATPVILELEISLAIRVIQELLE